MKKETRTFSLVLAGMKMVTALAYAAVAVLEYMGRNYSRHAKQMAA
jgi:hypothetical protein